MSEINIDLKPCPFCGSKNITAESEPSLIWLDREFGKVLCADCRAYIIGEDIPEHFEELENGLYRKVPMVKGIDAAIEHWNRRAGEEREATEDDNAKSEWHTLRD